jgi:outer membrane receptor protein involved in Fe transport
MDARSLSTFRSLSTAAARMLAVFFAGALLLAASARAQDIFGAIVGTISDPSGAVVPGATVTATNLATGEKRSVAAGGQGNYEILSLPVGNYKIDVDKGGFRNYSRSPIDVAVGQQVRVDVAMQVGQASEQVTVTGAPPIMQTDSASLSQVVEGQTVQTLPLNGRNVLNLVALVAGVVPQGSTMQNFSGQNVFAAGNYQIDGGTANQSAVLVDGAPVETAYGNNTVLVVDQDDVQEFNVQTHNNTAEYGMYTGGVINMTTKSGGNAFHGAAYEYLRNTNLDANNFFNNREGIGKQPWHQNQWGADLGGPIKHNKMFFFADYQGYWQQAGETVLRTVPTGTVPTAGSPGSGTGEYAGDFSAISEPIYNPFTTCGVAGNAACTPAQQAGTAPTRQQFSYNGHPNVIPPSEMSSVGVNLLALPYFAKSNVPGTSTPEGPVNNYASSAIYGGKNTQLNFRGDQNFSSKQTTFERYTWWKSDTIPDDPYHIGLEGNSSPEDFTTQQAVIGDTYVLSPTSIADVHLDYLRWIYTRENNKLGLNESTAFGWPSYMNFSSIEGLTNATTVPTLGFSGNISYPQNNQDYIFSKNNNFGISATYQKIWHGHAFKFGIDLRLLGMEYFQNNNAGGNFTFTNVFTGQSAGSPGETGNPIASMLVGAVNGSTVESAPPVADTFRYQGYFWQDTWEVNPKLTATLGLRYEVPGQFIAHDGDMDTFSETEANPALLAAGLNYPGAFDLVSTPQHPEAGDRPENYGDFSPRFGFAYRVTDNTVVRAAWGKYFIPGDTYFDESNIQSAVTFLDNNMITSDNGGQTPYNTLNNPFPTGLLSAPERNSNYQQILLGASYVQADLASQPSGETYQYNLAVEHQFPLGLALTAAYSGLKGDHLPLSNGALPINFVPDSVVAQAASDPSCAAGNTSSCFLTESVPSPFYASGLFKQGAQSLSTITKNYLYLPFPEYGAYLGAWSGQYEGISDYNALELTLQKHFSNGGQILGSYTYSKLLSNAETLTTWLEPTGGPGLGFQDFSNVRRGGEYSLSSFDARQRLTVGYVYKLPIGKGQMLLPNISTVGDELIGGWGLEGITTLQKGYPMPFQDNENNWEGNAFEGTERPNQVSGCSKKIGGSITAHLEGAFNTACFTVPALYTYGNEPRTDNTLRTPGIANWDMALFKDFSVTEKATLDFRVEAFNLFNRVQFSNPDTGLGDGTFGWISSTLNNPRLLQVSGRFTF